MWSEGICLGASQHDFHAEARREKMETKSVRSNEERARPTAALHLRPRDMILKFFDGRFLRAVFK